MPLFLTGIPSPRAAAIRDRLNWFFELFSSKADIPMINTSTHGYSRLLVRLHVDQFAQSGGG
jgi:hypothetical protein